MAMELSCEDFGLAKEEMLDRLIAKMAESFLDMDIEEDGPGEDSHYSKTKVLDHIHNMVKEQVEKSVAAIADKHVLPRVDEIITGMVMQTTNKWGEKKGEPKTLTEFVVERAENYLSEEVDFQGKNRKQATAYGSTFKPAQNRLMPRSTATSNTSSTPPSKTRPRMSTRRSAMAWCWPSTRC